MSELKHRGDDPAAIEVAEKHGLSYDGLMFGYHQFTVIEGAAAGRGITFYVTDLDQVEVRLNEKMKEFGL